MELELERTHKKYNALFATIVGLVSFFAFIMTVAPTAAFWDCGEYCATGPSLGIPHPPGNPLYILIARFFVIIFFFFHEAAFRINLLSVLGGTTSAIFMYLTASRVLVGTIGIPDTLWKRLSVYIGGVTAGFFAVFGVTFWSSCVEAEVLILSCAITALSVWLTVVWSQSKSANRDKLLLLIVYLTFIGIGVHMMSMILLGPFALFVILHDPEKLKDWRLWITGALLLPVMYDVSTFMWLGPTITLLTFIFSFKGTNRHKWRFCFWIGLCALLGYSIHLFIPIRSALNPIIDENHPVIEIKDGKVNWDALRDFLDRKQYGSESMITRMLWRRGQWANQFGIEGNMGYGGFHLTQFFHFSTHDTERSLFTDGAARGCGKLLIYLIPTFLMFFGWRYVYKRNKNLAILFITLLLMGTIVFIFYMNFADGTKSEKRDYMAWVKAGKQGAQPLVHREVRVRDYFWTHGFMFFGMWIGIAMGCLLAYLFTSKNRFLRTTVAPICTVLFAVSWALPMKNGWELNSRKNDWIPYDYAYNLLMSCDKDGILFTNGDNDTFPLWFLQEAVGIRRDVRLVNLSLINTKWYIKQMKNLAPKVPISYTEKQIDNDVDHILNPFLEPTRYTMSGAGITVTIPGRSQQNALRVQDQMVLNIVDANKWQKPVFFAVTVSDDNRMGLDPYMQMQGLVYRIYPTEVAPADRVDVEKTMFFVDKVFRYRGLGDGKTRFNDTSSKLLTNYSAAYIHIILALAKKAEELKPTLDSLSKIALDSTKKVSPEIVDLYKKTNIEYTRVRDIVVEKWGQCIGLIPWEWRFRAMRHDFFMRNGMYTEAEKYARQALLIDPNNNDYLKMLAQVLEQQGKKAELNELLKKLSSTDQNPWFAYMGLSKNYEDMGMYDSAIDVMREFEAMHPGDRRAKQNIARLEILKRDNTPQEILSGGAQK